MRRLIALLLSTTVVLAGCAGVPNTSAPLAIGTVTSNRWSAPKPG